MGGKEKMGEQVGKMMMKSKGGLLVTLCMCSLAPLIISTTFAGVYLSLGAVAQDYANRNTFLCGDSARCFDLCTPTGDFNADQVASSVNDMMSSAFSGSGSSGSSIDLSGFSQAMSGLASMTSVDTAWTAVFALNGGVYLTLTILTLCLVCSALLGPLALCGACLMGCAQCAHLAALIVTGVLRYSDDGEYCAKYGGPINDSLTFQDVGATMEGLFIAQAVLYCFYGCCIGVFTQMTVMLYMAKKAM